MLSSPQITSTVDLSPAAPDEYRGRALVSLEMRAWGVLLVLLSCTGCAAGLRLGAGPMVDTRAAVGASALVGAHFGVADGFGLLATLEGFAGGQGNPGAFVPGLATGFDVVHVSDDDAILFRVGPRLRARWLYGDGQAATHVGVELVVGGTFAALRDHGFGLEARLGVLSDSGAFDRGRPIGTLTLNIIYDIFGIDEPFD